MSLDESQREQNKNLKEFPYMTAEQLQEFISSVQDKDALTKEEIEFLRLNRRRMSIEKNRLQSDSDPAYQRRHALISNYNCKNAFPYKIVVLGEDTQSDKQSLIRLFSNSIAGQQEQTFDDDDMQTRVVEVSDKNNYCVQIWMPKCSKENALLRSMYYRSVDAFIIVYSIKSLESFRYARDVLLPEAARFVDSQLEQYAGTPILLVANHAEARTEHYSGHQEQLRVSAEDAIIVARQYGVNKYMEVVSTSAFHAHEIFRQTITTVEQAHEKNTSLTLQQRMIRSAKEDEFFRSMLTVVAPEGNFDQMDRTFELKLTEANADVTYYYTLDNTEPNRASSTKYQGPIQLKKPLPQEIKFIGYARGKFPSEVASFDVPTESDAPEGFFDAQTKSFIIETRPNTTYFYSLDGQIPGKDGQVYSGPEGIQLDQQGRPNGASLHLRLPESIKVIAVEQGKLRSSVATFKPFGVCPTPVAFYDSQSNMLRIERAPGYTYRYTLDGSTPTLDSYKYDAPILLPYDEDIKTIKIATFPLLQFPSRVVEIARTMASPRGARTPLSPPLAASAAATPIQTDKSIIKMTHSSMVRRNFSPQKSPRGAAPSTVNAMPKVAADAQRPKLIAFGSSVDRKLSSHTPMSTTKTSLTRSMSPIRTPSPSKGARVKDITPKEQEAMVLRKALTKKQSTSPLRRKTQEFKVEATSKHQNSTARPAASDQQQQESLVSCKTEGSNVEFRFIQNVQIQAVHVKTPGQNQGPAGYECFIIDEQDCKVTKIGKGDLEQIEGLQTLALDEQLVRQMPCQKMLVTFKTAPGQKTFKILDMKVDCKKVGAGPSQN